MNYKLTLGRGMNSINDTDSGHVFVSCLQIYDVNMPYMKLISKDVMMKCHDVLTPTDETGMRCPPGFLFYSDMCYKV